MDYMRTLITPGRLYSRLVTDFRKVCCEQCAHCILPVPETTTGGSWDLGEMPRECAECARAIADIVRRHQTQYDLLDPFSPFGTREPERGPTRH